MSRCYLCLTYMRIMTEIAGCQLGHQLWNSRKSQIYSLEVHSEHKMWRGGLDDLDHPGCFGLLLETARSNFGQNMYMR